MPEIGKHKRINEHLFKPLEYPFLVWSANRMPAWMNSDILTGLGILGAVIVLVGYWLSRFHPAFLWLASLGYVIHWYGDSLDGTLARVRDRQRPKFGFFIDHTTDSFSMILVFVGFGLSPYCRLHIALLALVGYLMISILVYLQTCVEGVFKITYSKIGPTEMRVIAILLNTLLFFLGNPKFRTPVGTLTFLDIFGLFAAAVLMAVFIVQTIRVGIVYAREDAAKLAERDKKMAAVKPRKKAR